MALEQHFETDGAPRAGALGVDRRPVFEKRAVTGQIRREEIVREPLLPVAIGLEALNQQVLERAMIRLDSNARAAASVCSTPATI